MNRVLPVCLTLSAVVNVFLLYRVLDTGVTTTYEASEIKSVRRELADMQKLFPVVSVGTSHEELVSAARKVDLEVIEKKQGNIYVGSVEFLLRDDKVAGVDFD
jgi:hypothetical protein